MTVYVLVAEEDGLCIWLNILPPVSLYELGFVREGEKYNTGMMVVKASLAVNAPGLYF